jgi:dipeptidase
MCDTIVAAFDGQPVWLAKNSDREPGEAQAVEWQPPSARSEPTRRCTHVEVENRCPRHAVVLSRPAWMWGAEMGINAHGVAIANEAVFTRVPVERTGLTGMDLLRLALERSQTARGAMETIVTLLRVYPQGGRMGHRNRSFRYHSSFAIADRTEAWVLETAGPLWAAARVRGLRTISNALTIGTDFDRIHDGAAAYAREQGWWSGRGDFDFAAAFARPAMGIAAGAAARRACTHRLVASRGVVPRVEDLIQALSSHDGGEPGDGWRMRMPCAHASWHPTRWAGQTTGSMIARLDDAPQAWFTGTSAPCLSVFKPVATTCDVIGPLGRAGESPDDSLWWTSERFHRAVLESYSARSSIGGIDRARRQGQALGTTVPDAMAGLWRAHHEALDDWTAQLRAARRLPRAFSLYWRWQSRRDGLQGPRSK